jgi:integrating conjugative element protein (TIGR03758 family)
MASNASSCSSQTNIDACLVTEFAKASGESASDINLFILAAISGLVLAWASWTVWGIYKSWTEGGIGAWEMYWGLIRTAIILMLFTGFVFAV